MVKENRIMKMQYPNKIILHDLILFGLVILEHLIENKIKNRTFQEEIFDRLVMVSSLIELYL